MTAIVEFKTIMRKGQPVHQVLLAPKGEGYTKSRTWHDVSRLMPPDLTGHPDPAAYEQSDTYQAMKGRWDIVRPAFESWLAAEEIPETGTALGAWGAISGDILPHLKNRGIRTVEDLAAQTPDSLGALPVPNGQKLPQMARDWLEGRTQAQATEEAEHLKAQIAEMQAMLAEQAKPKRGRPPKEADAA